MADQLHRLKAALADRYRIERELGSGGMATVYLAEDLKHERQVAVKVLRPELAAALGPERFHQEIKIAANLTHPNILTLIDSGEANGFLYYVMPYIEGESLRDKLAHEGELPIAEAVRILRDIVDALSEAHEKGVVHRDIKPDNVLLTKHHALVTDFGVAKAVSEATGAHKLTTDGVALGTPAYMSPEQAAADKHIDHRADIYAVGALAYELLTGRPPFTGTTPQEVLSAQVTQAPEPVTKYRATVPPALAQVVMKCLEKKAADRWQSAEELLPQLEALATPSGGITPTGMLPVDRVAKRRWMMVGGIIGIAAVVAVIVVLAAFPRGTGLRLNPNHVVVAVFRNETGDPSLDQLGKRAGQWITQGLQRAAISAAPWDLALQSSEYVSAEVEAGRVRDPVRALADETGAGVVVSGAIYIEGDSVEIQVNVTDAVRGRPLLAPDAVLGPRDAHGALVETLAQQILGSLAVSFDERLAGVADVMGNAPSLEAYQAFDAGMELYYSSEHVEAVQQFMRAFEIDTTFLTSLVYAMYSASNDARTRSVYDSLRLVLHERRDELSPYDAYMVDAMWASGQGDYAGFIAAYGRAAGIAPGSKAAYNYARALGLANRPRQAIEVLTSSLQPEKGAMRGWYSHWTVLAGAYHLAGEYDLALEVTGRARELYPRLIDVVEARGVALAAKGRVDEILTLLDQSATFRSGVLGNPGDVMTSVGAALSAHGFEEGARQVFELTLQWFESRPSQELSSLANRRGIWFAQAFLGQLEDAQATLVQILRDFPDALFYVRVYLAWTSARLGDPAEAQMMLDSLGATTGPGHRTRAFFCGILAEALGERDQAVAFLREYFTDTGFDNDHIYVPSLRGYPPFEELMRPKG